jgi:hypothetical protein
MNAVDLKTNFKETSQPCSPPGWMSVTVRLKYSSCAPAGSFANFDAFAEGHA